MPVHFFSAAFKKKYPNRPLAHAESLERRTMLSVNPAPNGTGTYVTYTLIGSALQPTEYDGSTITVNPGATVDIDVQVTGSGTPPMTPTGSVYVTFFGGDMTQGTGSENIAISGSNGVATGSASFTFPKDGDPTGDYLECYYSGDSYYSSGEFFNYPNLDVNFAATNQLAFIQQPSNSAVGDKIAPPVTVQEQQSSGAPIDTSTTPVTLSLASGTGTLSGTLTEPAVNGLATFSDLSIDTSGAFTLTATASNFTSTNSSLFNITAGKLVFTKAPKDGSAGAALKPAVTVSLEDAKGKVITSDSSTVVTLNPIGLTSDNPITGNTATLNNGVATFPNLVLTQPGFYQLQASDDGDTVATSGKFKITGDHLLFKKQPANGDQNRPIPLTVELLDATNKVVTDATSSVALSLNTISGGANAILSGTTTLPFIAGVAVFSSTAGPMLDTVGAYTLTATEEDTATGVLAPTNTTTAITTHQFSIAGLHLQIVKEPGTINVFDPIPLSVAVVDSHNKRNTSENTAQVQLTLTTVSGGEGASLQGVTTATFQSGLATFTGSTAPMLNGGGTFTLTATEIGTSTPAASVVTKSFKILPDILKPIPDPGINSTTFLATRGNQILNTSNYGRGYYLEVCSPQGQPITLSQTLISELPDVVTTVVPVSTGAAVDHSFDSLGPMYTEVDANARPRVIFPISTGHIFAFETPGTYKLLIGPAAAPYAGASNPNAALSALAPLTTSALKAVDPVIYDQTSARVVAVGDTFTANVHLVIPDSANPASTFLTTNSNVGVHFDLLGGASDENYAQVLPSQANATLDLQIHTPGKYKLVISVVYTPGDSNGAFNNANYVEATGLVPVTIPITVTG
jgi:hypothetical protein